MPISPMATSGNATLGLLIVIAASRKPERRAGLKPKTLATTLIPKSADARRAMPCGQVTHA